MEVYRAYIALDLPVHIIEKLQQVSSNLQNQLKDLPLRWVPVKNIHLTLKFIGDLSARNVDMIASILNAESRHYQPFEISIGCMGTFPNIRHPRVIWVGVEAPKELISLSNKIESEITRLGYDAENRPFSPHLTIARTSRKASLPEINSISESVQKEKLGFLGVATISEIILYRSELKMNAAVYTKLFTAPLGHK